MAKLNVVERSMVAVSLVQMYQGTADSRFEERGHVEGLKARELEEYGTFLGNQDGAVIDRSDLENGGVGRTFKVLPEFEALQQLVRGNPAGEKWIGVFGHAFINSCREAEKSPQEELTRWGILPGEGQEEVVGREDADDYESRQSSAEGADAADAAEVKEEGIVEEDGYAVVPIFRLEEPDWNKGSIRLFYLQREVMSDLLRRSEWVANEWGHVVWEMAWLLALQEFGLEARISDVACPVFTGLEAEEQFFPMSIGEREFLNEAARDEVRGQLLKIEVSGRDARNREGLPIDLIDLARVDPRQMIDGLVLLSFLLFGQRPTNTKVAHVVGNVLAVGNKVLGQYQGQKHTHLWWKVRKNWSVKAICK